MPFDIGPWEFLAIAVIALLVIGPERLPRYAAQAAQLLRQLRTMATQAREQISESVDLDGTGLKDLADLHPKRFAASLLGDLDEVREELRDTGRVAREHPADLERARAAQGVRPADQRRERLIDDDVITPLDDWDAAAVDLGKKGSGTPAVTFMADPQFDEPEPVIPERTSAAQAQALPSPYDPDAT